MCVFVFVCVCVRARVLLLAERGGRAGKAGGVRDRVGEGMVSVREKGGGSGRQG